MLKNIFIVFLLFSFILAAQSTKSTVIVGKVVDAKTRLPIENANVYLLKSIKGSSTNSSGKYKIENVSNGSFSIMAACVGYENNKKTVRIENDKKIEVDFILKPKVYKLPEVTVASEEDDEWQDNFKLFRKYLIGTSSFAEKTKILNPYSINFSHDKEDWLIAKTNKPLLIENKALGYKLTYFLKLFRTDGITIQYAGDPSFKELKPKNNVEMQRWIKNRLQAYCGSLRHFLYTISKQYLIVKNIKSSTAIVDSNSFVKLMGFEVLSTNTLPNQSKYPPIFQPVNVVHLLSPGLFVNELRLSFDDYLRVVYTKKLEDKKIVRAWYGYSKEIDYPLSWISLSFPAAAIDKEGRYSTPFVIHNYGYWSFHGLADNLPYEYSVPDSVLENIDFVSN
ncbi:hypothetical protein BMS3Abin04_00615 [bacterium BMS3Abin04]|nr:hypothetical protein BMS3Abin04_00615 [bacterium BMS3Abin04]